MTEPVIAGVVERMEIAFRQVGYIKRAGRTRSFAAATVYLYLTFRADKRTGKVKRSVRRIAKDLDATESHVEKSLALLLHAGLLDKRLDDRKAGRWPVTIYTLLEPPAQPTTHRSGRRRGRTDRNRPPSTQGSGHRPHPRRATVRTPVRGVRSERSGLKGPVRGSGLSSSTRLGGGKREKPPSKRPSPNAARTSRRPDGSVNGAPTQADLDRLAHYFGPAGARQFMDRHRLNADELRRKLRDMDKWSDERKRKKTNK